jgi:hypothetical protein
MNPDSHDLIQRHMAGLLTEDEAGVLQTRLKADTDLRRLYLHYMNLDVALEAQAGSRDRVIDLLRAAPLTENKPAGRWLSWRPLAAAAAAVLLAAGWWVQYERLHREVARFGALQDCRWVDAKLNVAPGDGVRRGQRVELASGSVEIEFRSGAVATLLGPCIFEVESAMGGFLTLGQMKTRAATPESKGFTVRTRTARVVDLGTEFVTSAGADGLSRVEVTSGEVVVHVVGERTPQHLQQGDALSVEAGSAQVIARIESGDETSAFRFPTIEPPSDRDDADARQGHAVMRLVRGELRKTPSPGGGSGPLEALLDGRAQSSKDAPTESVFMDDGTSGWLQLDLGSAVSITKINTYSWHQALKEADNRVRAVQQFVLYGFAGDAPPAIAADRVSAGWVPIARVNTDESFQIIERTDRPAQQACSISSTRGTLGRYRYLLWHVQPSRDPVSHKLNNTFYGEFDVYAQP